MEIRKNISLSAISTFGIGGTAEHFIETPDEESLNKAIRWAESERIVANVCAGASNIIFPDGTLKGLLIRIKGGKIEQVSEEHLVADAGVDLSELVNFANERGLEGLETLAGIPGTVGGAVAGNAGAYGRSISETVKRVRVLEAPDQVNQKKTNSFWITNEECGFDYRESNFKHYPILATKVKLRLKKGNKANLKKKSAGIIEIREAKYKPGLKCPGSFFKNIFITSLPEETLKKIDESKIIEGKIPAGWLLEKVGAKGMRCGGIKVADFHGNLFINESNGTAKEVKKLASDLKAKVIKEFGIMLEEEVRYF